MSTPKKVRATYEDTFKKLISTSEGSKKLREFLSQLQKPAPITNLPLKLSEVRLNLFSSMSNDNAAKKQPKRKAAKAHEIKQPPSKKSRRK